MSYAEERLAAQTPPEFPVATHDGLIWPLPRQAMRDPKAVAQRMADDMNTLRREHGYVDAALLVERGWSAEQIRLATEAAIEIASALWAEAA